jgi:hypothetical protein
VPKELVQIIGNLLNHNNNETSDDESEEDELTLEQPINHHNLIVEQQIMTTQEDIFINEFETPHQPIKEPLPAIPIEERKAAFITLLNQHKVSPFSSWLLESKKLSDDIRFTQIPTNKERKSIFNGYCETKSLKVLEERSKKTSQDVYVDLVEEYVNPRTKYEDFVRRFKRDVRFTKFENVKLKEQLFLKHISKIKLEKDMKI